MARPCVLVTDPTVHTKIVAALRSGSFPEPAAALAGVSKRSYFRWLEQGRAEVERRTVYDNTYDTVDADEKKRRAANEPFYAFAVDVEEAISYAEIATLNELRKGDRGWQAKAWILERRFPKRWSISAGKQQSDKRSSVDDWVNHMLGGETDKG